MSDLSPVQRILSDARNQDRLWGEFVAACKAACVYPFEIHSREVKKAYGYPIDGEVEEYEGRT